MVKMNIPLSYVNCSCYFFKLNEFDNMELTPCLIIRFISIKTKPTLLRDATNIIDNASSLYQSIRDDTQIYPTDELPVIHSLLFMGSFIFFKRNHIRPKLIYNIHDYYLRR